MSVFTAEVLFLSRLMVNLLAIFFFTFCLLWHDYLLSAVFLNWNCDTPNILEWNSQQVFCLLYVLFYQYIKSHLACWMKHSQGRISSLSFENTFKATCNLQSQLVGDVCLQIYFVSDGFRHQWAVTPPVKTTYLATVTFNFLATPNTSGPTSASGCHYRRTIATQVVVVQVSMWSGLMASSELSSTKSSEQ